MKRITLCKLCHDSFYPELRLPEGTATYLATGYCSYCKRKASVKRYQVTELKEGL